MMQLRDISFCATFRHKLTTARAVCGSVSRLDCYDKHMRARAAKQGRERRILLSHILILLSCCLPLAFCDPIGGATATAAAAITSPAPSSKLTSASTTFTWSAGSGGVTGYYLWVGTTLGGYNLAKMGPFSGTSATATLPANGTTIYVRLWTFINGGATQLSNDYSYTEASVAAAAITSPTPSSTLTSASTTFTWSAATGASSYYLWVGTTLGGYNLANMGPFSGTSATVTLPTNGATIYVRLWTFINGGATQLHNDYTYTEASVAAAAITSPAPSSTLTSASTTFTWSAATGASSYYLWVGTTLGGYNLANMGPFSGTSATVTLPTNGATIYVRLWTFINGGATQLHNDYTFTEAPPAAATIISPPPSSTLLSASTTFMWSAATGASSYYLWVGTTLGGYNLANMGPFSGTSATVTLPTNGTTIYVRLWTFINGGATQLHNDYTYSAASSSPTLSGLSCSSASMTVAGTDNCTVKLSTAAATGGLVVSVASNNSVVTVPASVTVAAGATAANFTATVSAVSKAQTVTLTASAKGVAETFALQLGASVPTLSIEATSIAFGNVVLNSPATQSLTLSSTGIAPVTVSAATVTGTGFTASGVTFPLTLNPNQTATLSVQFDPTVAGAATGQLTITSNSSTGTYAVVSLSGTGAATAYEVNLTWDAPTSSPDPVAGYDVYRSPSGASSYVQLNSSVVAQAAYTDTSVQAGQTYDYIVESVDASGVTSVPSNMAGVTLP
jgi:hypothetical protein